MHGSRQKVPNPWNKNVQHKKPKQTSHNLENPPLTSSEVKFKEARSKLQAAVKKHVKDYESSSEEEELDSNIVIDDILKNYKNTGGDSGNIGRTQNFIEEAFLSGAATCLICISRIKRDDKIWSCSSCYGFFHVMCIQRWSKDTITQQKQALEGQIIVHSTKLCWCCPKCRFEYNSEDIPTKYLCFCKKTENPKFEPFLVPHSCGEICKKDLVPKCGHKCLLLCHPGPCPPCPVTVSVSCYCGSQQLRTQRCSNKEWSCQNACGRTLECEKHTCTELCHPGNCKPCPKKSIQKCMCKSQQKLRDCATPIWQCNKVCNKPLECGNHRCQEVCHAGVCDSCSLNKPRTCPCGRTTYELPCTEDTPTCPDTCDKLLECGIHTCNQRCHKDKCGPCLETVEKACRCGQHSKEVQCSKPYFCETKCKNMKDCNKHPCNRKCCDGNCPPCEKPCGRTLRCGNHKCNSICHSGPCFPCMHNDVVSCRCGLTETRVPCGSKHKTKPPKCSKICSLPPDCHHEKRENHRCHFGECPPCRQMCNKLRTTCPHPCTAPCHSSVLVKIEGQKASMPWEQTKPKIERRALPCPDCVIPMPVTCLGEHETANWPCHLAKPSSCHRSCGRLLECENHTCTLPCHIVEEAPDKLKAGSNCEQCESTCVKERPDGCPHSCPKPCHPGLCPPCKHMLRIKCHCGLTQPYVSCNDWLNLDKREELQSCGNQCPKNFWDWFINITDLRIHWKYEPTYVISQFAFLFGGVATFLHAMIRGGRLPYLWLGILIHGIVVECLSYAIPDVDNFWHSQTPIIFLGRRLPLHILALYPCFIYNSSIAVAKMRLPKWSEPFAVGLGAVLVDIPYDIISVNFLHWTWHDTDPNIYDRHYWVPWNSYYFHSNFAASFTFWFHFTRAKICNSEGKWIADKSIAKELLCSVIAGILGTPGGVLMFIPIYHPLHDNYKLHSEVTFFIIFAIFLLLIWSGDRKPKNDEFAKTVPHETHWTTWLLISHLVLHYSSFMIMPVLFNPEDEISMGLKEPIGPCDEYVDVRTAFGKILQKRKYLCATDYDEKYFDWSCLPGGKPPSNGSSWYTTCGVPFPNRVEYIAIIALLCLIATVVFGNLHFRSFGDAVFTYKDKKINRDSERSTKKKKVK